MSIFTRHDFAIDATGLEISEEEIRFARNRLGVELKHQLLSEHSEFDYSILTLFNVIEHVSDPLAMLKEAYLHIDSGGCIALTTPNPLCINVKLRGLKRWKMISPPHHINIFTKSNLSVLLSMARFTPIRYETMQTAFRLLRKYDRKHRLTILKPAAYYALRMLNLGTDHFVIAKKS